ncbi:MAG: Rieske 2Fe-2S domain-containing protein [Byssovorax sp.]
MSDQADKAPREKPRWREDFPVRWAQERYVSRRELAKFLTLGSALLATAGGVIAAIGNRGRREPKAPEVRVADASSVPVGGSALFRYPTSEDPCILVRGQDGSLRAFSQVCTHLSCAVVYQPARDELFCPCHHGVFSARDGRPLAGPPVRRLPMIQVEQRGDDVVAIGIGSDDS